MRVQALSNVGAGGGVRVGGGMGCGGCTCKRTHIGAPKRTARLMASEGRASTSTSGSMSPCKQQARSTQHPRGSRGVTMHSRFMWGTAPAPCTAGLCGGQPLQHAQQVHVGASPCTMQHAQQVNVGAAACPPTHPPHRQAARPREVDACKVGTVHDLSDPHLRDLVADGHEHAAQQVVRQWPHLLRLVDLLEQCAALVLSWPPAHARRQVHQAHCQHTGKPAHASHADTRPARATPASTGHAGQDQGTSLRSAHGGYWPAPATQASTSLTHTHTQGQPNRLAICSARGGETLATNSWLLDRGVSDRPLAVCVVMQRRARRLAHRCGLEEPYLSGGGPWGSVGHADRRRWSPVLFFGGDAVRRKGVREQGNTATFYFLRQIPAGRARCPP